MPAGEAFSADQKHEIERAIDYARTEGRLAVSVYVGELTAPPRARALELHAGFGPAAAETLLVAVDPGGHYLEIVTGAALHLLDERTCALAAATMTSAFVGGDLAGGIVSGIQMLAGHSRHPKVLHADRDS